MSQTMCQRISFTKAVYGTVGVNQVHSSQLDRSLGLKPNLLLYILQSEFHRHGCIHNVTLGVAKQTYAAKRSAPNYCVCVCLHRSHNPWGLGSGMP